MLSELIRERFCCEVVDVDVRDTSLVPGKPVVIYDGERLPFPDNSFDCVLLLFVLHHCLNQAQVAREAARVCAGRVIVLEDTYLTQSDLMWLRMVHWYLDKVEGMPLAECKFLRPFEWVKFFEHCGLSFRGQTRLPLYMDFLPPGNTLFELLPRRGTSFDNVATQALSVGVTQSRS